MAGRKNKGMLCMISARYADGAGFEQIDKMIAEMMAFRLPDGEPDASQAASRTKETARGSRLPKAERPRCGARTRQGSPCKRRALANGRCPNHGGLSSGPKTKAGRARIAEAQIERWERYRAEKTRLSKKRSKIL